MGAWASGAWAPGAWAGTVWATGEVVPQSPTDIQISRSFVRVDAGLNATVGTLTAVDVDSESHTFTLVAGTGDTNNADFAIAGNVLTCDDPATLGIGTYSIRVQADDGESTPYAKALTIEVRAAQSARKIIAPPVSDPIGYVVVDPVVGM